MKNTNVKMKTWAMSGVILFGLISFIGQPITANATPSTTYGIAVTDPWVTIRDDRFYINNGQDEIFFVGGNTPWDDWNSFGSNWNVPMKITWWDEHFAALKAAGVNATRIWINCDAWGGPVRLNADGAFDQFTNTFWSDVDALFELTLKHEIYIMATMMSFDHTEQKSEDNSYLRWRVMLRNSNAMQSVVDNYLVPFAERYKSNPYLWSIDLCNEPDWIFENASGGNIPWANICEFFARAAIGLRNSESRAHVTVGMAMIKYNSNASSKGDGVDRLSASYLQSLVSNEPDRHLAYLDFYSPHHYGWMSPYWGRPMQQKPGNNTIKRDVTTASDTAGYWGEDVVIPAMLGEAPVNSDGGSTLKQDYIDAYKNGWTGLLAWSTNGVDNAGNLTGFLTGVEGFYEVYPELKLGIWGGEKLPVWGDVNDDGLINAADLTLLRRYIAAIDKDVFIENNSTFNLVNADVNGDGYITITDVTRLRRYLAATDPSTVSLGFAD